jgi:hypothetical protein
MDIWCCCHFYLFSRFGILYQEKSGNPAKHVNQNFFGNDELQKSTITQEEEATHKNLNCCETGCQMVYFQTKNPNLGKFWRALEWKMLLYFMIIWNFNLPFGIIHGRLVYLCIVIWCIFPNSVCLEQEKSGNPAAKPEH